MSRPVDVDLTLTSGTVHGRRFGPADAPLALCVHGLSANLHAFDYLAERGRRPGPLGGGGRPARPRAQRRERDGRFAPVTDNQPAEV